MKVGMVVFSYYPADPRVRREAEALSGEGATVDVICLRGKNESRMATINGVNAHRINITRRRGSKLSYILEYFFFIVLALLKLSMLYIRRRYDVVHIHNMPDILVFTAFLAKIMGAKVILDLHDPTPEVYMAKYGIDQSHPVIKLLIHLERWSIWFADMVLTPNIAFRNLFVMRGCPERKIHIVMNSPQEDIFCRNDVQGIPSAMEREKRFIMMYHGTIVERHGLDTALMAISSLKDKIPGLLFHVYGEGDFVHSFLELVNELGLQNIVRYHGQVSLETIAERIFSIDVGVIPNKRSPFTEINMPTRIFEYLCMRKPVVVPRTQGIGDYFDEESIYFFEPGNSGSLAEAILRIYSEPNHCREVMAKAEDIYQNHRWHVQREYFVKQVAGLVSNQPHFSSMQNM